MPLIAFLKFVQQLILNNYSPHFKIITMKKKINQFDILNERIDQLQNMLDRRMRYDLFWPLIGKQYKVVQKAKIKASEGDNFYKDELIKGTELSAICFTFVRIKSSMSEKPCYQYERCIGFEDHEFLITLPSFLENLLIGKICFTGYLSKDSGYTNSIVH